ncbi:helix-turn-helix domain-containing protein [Collinsella sp. AGMB00827]|uniref:Helix-turn-helix domain-containing protein n=1 Tax=Collinsella ureilytica TaxID=2869515 RepID=A0ABS7MM17_9ACTN|nr:helix-turn-helix transcriptional regulator [Collinsella urealyticum]MBY4798317.1 helix-turn-helix domain-containing protein [Collinsella urealyticum]
MKLKIRELRKARGITQGNLAALLSVDIKTVGNWELGKTLPDISQAWNIAVALNTDLNELLGWYEDHPMTGSPHISHDEEILLRDYRAATPERRRALTMTARDYAGMSKASEVDSRQVEKKKAV